MGGLPNVPAFVLLLSLLFELGCICICDVLQDENAEKTHIPGEIFPCDTGI